MLNSSFYILMYRIELDFILIFYNCQKDDTIVTLVAHEERKRRRYRL